MSDPRLSLTAAWVALERRGWKFTYAEEVFTARHKHTVVLCDIKAPVSESEEIDLLNGTLAIVNMVSHE